jgi:hypothetical protein
MLPASYFEAGAPSELAAVLIPAALGHREMRGSLLVVVLTGHPFDLIHRRVEPLRAHEFALDHDLAS